MLMQAGVIMKRSGERLEDVTIKSVTDSEIVYELNGQEIIVAKTDVSAILYDDGRYEEINVPINELDSTSISSNQSMYRVNDIEQYYDRSGRLIVAFTDKKYSKECRKKGAREYMSVYKASYAKYKKSGLSSRDARNEAIIAAVQASDHAVHECAGEL